MVLNEMGRTVSDCWVDLPNHYKHVVLDEFVIMPDHFHGILVFTDTVGGTGSGDVDDTMVGGCVWARGNVWAIHESPIRKTPQPPQPPQRECQIWKPSIRETTQPMDIKQRRNMGLSKLVGRFKMVSAKQINILRNTPGVPVWQRNYYEHIIRNESELNRIRKYIINNPLNWKRNDCYDE